MAQAHLPLNLCLFCRFGQVPLREFGPRGHNLLHEPPELRPMHGMPTSSHIKPTTPAKNINITRQQRVCKGQGPHRVLERKGGFALAWDIQG